MPSSKSLKGHNTNMRWILNIYSSFSLQSHLERWISEYWIIAPTGNMYTHTPHVIIPLNYKNNSFW